MKEYKVCITEVLDKWVIVRAETPRQAEEIVSEQYKNEEIVLDYNDFSHYEIEVIEEIKEGE